MENGMEGNNTEVTKCTKIYEASLHHIKVPHQDIEEGKLETEGNHPLVEPNTNQAQEVTPKRTSKEPQAGKIWGQEILKIKA